MTSRTPVERREHDRFQIKDMGLASLGSSFDITGKILNISKLGLAFRYVTKDWRLSESGTLNILLLGGTWRLRNVPFENIKYLGFLNILRFLVWNSDIWKMWCTIRRINASPEIRPGKLHPIPYHSSAGGLKGRSTTNCQTVRAEQWCCFSVPTN
jgi:hypothetical protein